MTYLKAVVSAVALGAIVFGGVYALNESLWAFGPIGSSLLWAALMATGAAAFTFVDQLRHG
jgi:hypothetical protein